MFIIGCLISLETHLKVSISSFLGKLSANWVSIFGLWGVEISTKFAEFEKSQNKLMK